MRSLKPNSTCRTNSNLHLHVSEPRQLFATQWNIKPLYPEAFRHSSERASSPSRLEAAAEKLANGLLASLISLPAMSPKRRYPLPQPNSRLAGVTIEDRHILTEQISIRTTPLFN
jgi:hypothetical protein